VNPIVLAIPAFLALITLELWVAHHRGRRVYDFDDSVACVSTGLLQLFSNLGLRALVGVAYLGLYADHRLLALPSSEPWVWALAFLGVDLIYYWFHRFSHEVNLPWAAHIVHHQSEQYNLSVALRQGAFQGAFSWVFYLPLALCGVSPFCFATVKAANTLYQFWIHTRLIDRLGPLEIVFNTPSHHRVHHARNTRYLDRNYAGTLIIWDRLFGTFCQETVPVDFGTTRPLRSSNPLWANFEHWRALWIAATMTRDWPSRILLFVKPPAWLPRDVDRAELASALRSPVLASSGSPILATYVGLHALPLIPMTFLALLEAKALPSSQVALLALFVTGTLGALGGLLDGRRWAPALECTRLCVSIGIASWLLWSTPYWAASLAAPLVLGGAIFFLACALAEAREHFMRRGHDREAAATPGTLLRRGLATSLAKRPEAMSILDPEA
jgi:alkylglycerol monooxygenase